MEQATTPPIPTTPAPTPATTPQTPANIGIQTADALSLTAVHHATKHHAILPITMSLLPSTELPAHVPPEAHPLQLVLPLSPVLRI